MESVEGTSNCVVESCNGGSMDLSSSVKRISSGSHFSGFGDMLQDDRWIDVDKTLNCLKSTISIGYQQVEEIVRLSKESVCEWQQEQELKAQIEALVMRDCIWSLEEKLCDIKHGRMKELSSLRQEFDIISKSLSVSEVGQLSSHGSLEGDEEINGFKKGDCSHRKVLNNLKSSSSSPPSSLLTKSTSISTSTSSGSLLMEENGKHDESEINIQEILDSAQKMSKDELINEMTKLKRNHESQLRDMTEQQFSLKRELLKESGSSLPSKKSKEFDMLRRRISEVISKLDELLVKNEQIATFGVYEESLASLKDTVESLVSENHQLKELLTNKEEAVKCLSLQVSETADKMSVHSLAEAELLKTTTNLQSAIEEAHIEASIHEDAFACILREMMMDQIKFMAEESEVEYNFMQEIYESEIEDLNMEFIVMQEVYAVIFREALKDAEMGNLEKQKQVEVVVANEEKLKQQVIFLAKEKEQLAQEKERYELSAQELENLRGETCRQQKLISESVEESNATHRTLVEALNQIERHKTDICNLDQKLKQTMKELRDVNQEKQNAVSLFEAKERELKEQLGSIAVSIQILLNSVTYFERRVTRDISRKSSRLKNLSSQVPLLKENANELVRRELVCKQKFERKCSDLEKAEAEVDLLGDEVDTILSLAEKLYISLDHYSPILQHYPGITEILKLLRRELIKWRNKEV